MAKLAPIPAIRPS